MKLKIHANYIFSLVRTQLVSWEKYFQNWTGARKALHSEHRGFGSW